MTDAPRAPTPAPTPAPQGDPDDAIMSSIPVAKGGTPKIAVRDLHKAFGAKQVLRGVDLDIADGESVVVIGGSGTGKSVLLKCILGILTPDRGSIKIDGVEVVGMRHRDREAMARKFGMLFQGGALFDSLPVWENIATRPEIIFFDEPTTGLDPIMSDVINDLIVACVHELGATALSITHDMASARKIAHRIAMLHQGRIVWAGPVADIDASGNPYVDQFIHGRAEGPIHMQVRRD